MSKTSILAETLAEIKEIKEGIQSNANHILKSTLKEDLEAIVRKGLNEAEEDIETDDMVGDDEPTNQISQIDEPEEMGSDELDMEPTMEPEDGDTELIDLTNEPFDKVSDTFERMQLTDEIEIVKTPEGGYQINIEPESDGLEMGDEESPMDEPEMGDVETDDIVGDEMGDEESPMDEPELDEPETEDDEEAIKEEEEVVYEIEISDDEMVNETTDEMEESEDKTEMEESEDNMEEDVKHVKAKSSMKHNADELHESLVATRKKLRTLVTENKNKSRELKKVTALVEEFKDSEKEYKSAIKSLKGQLQEVALFTSNLTYAVKLMTENATTKDEKLDILKRFDSAKTLTESREVFNSLATLFESNKTNVENTIKEQVLKTPKASGSTNLNESTAYKNPQLERMLDIIQKIK